MKLITAIAALALLAGSMDVEAQKRGKVGKPGGGKKPGTHQKAPDGAEEGKPKIASVAHLAIGAFSQLDPEERKDLAEAAQEGDEEAKEELRAERVEAIEAMIEAMEDPESRKLIELGVMLTGLTNGDYRVWLTGDKAEFDNQAAGKELAGQATEERVGDTEWLEPFPYMDGLLDNVQELLTEQIENMPFTDEDWDTNGLSAP